MSKRSAAVSELENHLREMVGPSGALLETRWVGRLVELMRETANTEAREHLLKVLLATPQADKTTPSRFIQLGGVDLLGRWINEHRRESDPEDKQVLHSVLSCLNKLNISLEILQRTEIGKTVNGLSKHMDSSISAKAVSIVSKWKKQVAPPSEKGSESAQKITKLVKESRIAPIKRCQPPSAKVEERLPMPQPEEVYLPPKSPSPEPYQPRLRWVEDDYLLAIRFFYRNDEPNAKCASERPLEEDLPAEKTLMSVDDFRKREDMMTRELSKKVASTQERQVEGQILEHLRNMKPVVTFVSPLRTPHPGLKLKRRPRLDTHEMKEQARREQDLARITYPRESEIPRAPREPAGRAETHITPDTPLIPLVCKNPHPPPAEEKPAAYLQPPAMPFVPPPMQADPYYQLFLSQMSPLLIGQKKRVQIDPRTNKPVNYKTVPCRLFHSPSGCTRGDNCHFIHDTNYSGRPIPSDWKKNSDVRQKSTKMENLVPGPESYYGSESHAS